ncbi:hypothetical protein [Streptomyces sp. NPDC005096]|uniref:hypothetical protein n=1 Tax=Streptomyces sp. NPDC005096 TaxID=3154559 RepID=UPI0033A2AB28
MTDQQSGDGEGTERKRRVVRRRRDMDFTPVRNGMDFLLSAFDHLSQRDGVPGRRDLKYAVLHLQAAVEVLLKARLIREHWSLVFSDPGKAKKADYDKGSFTSCTVLAAVDRLNNIVTLQITKEQRQAISSLADTRNALTHLGHTGSVYAVEAQAATVLDFLLSFIHEELRPALSSEAAYVKATMEQLSTRLGQVKALVKQRSQRLERELRPLADRVVQCGECQQWAFVLGEDEPSCRFCLATCVDGHDAAVSQLERGTADAIAHCPTCEWQYYTVVVGARVAKNKTASVDLCFHCLTDYAREDVASA